MNELNSRIRQSSTHLDSCVKTRHASACWPPYHFGSHIIRTQRPACSEIKSVEKSSPYKKVRPSFRTCTDTPSTTSKPLKTSPPSLSFQPPNLSLSSLASAHLLKTKETTSESHLPLSFCFLVSVFSSQVCNRYLPYSIQVDIMSMSTFKLSNYDCRYLFG